MNKTYIGDEDKVCCYLSEGEDGRYITWVSKDREFLFFICFDGDEPSWHYIDKDYKNTDYGALPEVIVEVFNRRE